MFVKRRSYDRKAVGKRLRNQRKQFDWDRKFVAGKIGVVEKYYADIERGTCGMSIETLIALTELYGISIDFLIYGSEENFGSLTQDKTLLKNLQSMSPKQLENCRQLLKLFVNGVHIGEAEREVRSVADPAESAVI